MTEVGPSPRTTAPENRAVGQARGSDWIPSVGVGWWRAPLQSDPKGPGQQENGFHRGPGGFGSMVKWKDVILFVETGHGFSKVRSRCARAVWRYERLNPRDMCKGRGRSALPPPTCSSDGSSRWDHGRKWDPTSTINNVLDETPDIHPVCMTWSTVRSRDSYAEAIARLNCRLRWCKLKVHVIHAAVRISLHRSRPKPMRPEFAR
ncbi:hypothetical protein PDE_06021 [Penicillium oxalicum 114-2]|uniref:Uncharacterized protein n=2 Tax=Penicillium oxalicum TaxID=69781 RepID=S8B8I3_PENO1|nr:hypothetical protein PDE_06021 [Penicillium oxalicum 114-2]